MPFFLTQGLGMSVYDVIILKIFIQAFFMGASFSDDRMVA